MSNDTKDTGGPAFPGQFREFTDPFDNGDLQEVTVISGGMTLRDYFAAKATDTDVRAALLPHEYEDNSTDRTCARYRHADEMLKAREQ